MPEQVTIGFDWSMNSPAICIHIGNEWHFKNCIFKYFTGKAKHQIKSNRITGWPIPIYDPSSDLNRWMENAKWAGERISSYSCAFLGLEGYAYGSRGSLPFSIAENTALLKYTIKQLFPEEKLNIFAPTVIKKYATGNGKANKEKMYGAFIEETKFDLTEIIPAKCGENPISDIVDSYFIAKLTFYESTKN